MEVLVFSNRTVWKFGKSIRYSGVWEGKTYEDKGKILEFVRRKPLKSTYWSSLSGLPDTPEHRHITTHTLTELDGYTTLTVTQENIATKEAADHSESNWASVLKTMKGLLEQ
jgi:hypothetical protein